MIRPAIIPVIDPRPEKVEPSLITTTYGIANDATGSTKPRSAPLDFAYTGNYGYSSGSLNNATTNGLFWSRTAYDSSNAYRLSFNSSSVNPQYVSSRGNGYVVRCTAK